MLQKVVISFQFIIMTYAYHMNGHDRIQSPFMWQIIASENYVIFTPLSMLPRSSY